MNTKESEGYYMNGYKMLADSYRRFLDDPTADQTDVKAHIKALDFLAECDKKTVYRLFDSSAFNDIIKGYVYLIANGLEDLTDDQRKAIKGRISRLLDDTGAEQAENYYINN